MRLASEERIEGAVVTRDLVYYQKNTGVLRKSATRMRILENSARIRSALGCRRQSEGLEDDGASLQSLGGCHRQRQGTLGTLREPAGPEGVRDRDKHL